MCIRDRVEAADKIPNVVDVHQHLILCYQKTGESDKEMKQRQVLEMKLGMLEEAQRERMQAVIGNISHE